MQPKTRLAPNAPWPDIHEKPKPKPKAPPKPRTKRKTAQPKLALPSVVLDIFEEARRQIATGAARGPFQRGAKNTKNK